MMIFTTIDTSTDAQANFFVCVRRGKKRDFRCYIKYILTQSQVVINFNKTDINDLW